MDVDSSDKPFGNVEEEEVMQFFDDLPDFSDSSEDVTFLIKRQ